MRGIIVCLLVSDWCVLLFEEDLVWSQWLFRSFVICDIVDKTTRRDSP